MNGYLTFVDGRLAPPDTLTVNIVNNSTLGRVAHVALGKLAPTFVDVLEMRSGYVVTRFHGHADDETKDTLVCQRVANVAF